MSLTLETPRLLIRTFCDTDLETFLAYRNDPEVYRYQGWKTPFTREAGMDFIARTKIVVPGTPGEWLQLAIEHKDSHEVLGDVAFHVTHSNPQQAYIAYSLARPFWGQGYATEAVSTLLDYAFFALGLHRVTAVAAPLPGGVTVPSPIRILT